MENPRRQKSHSTGDLFTFPSISQSANSDSELADQLFSNGKFLLHDFPVQPPSFTIPRSTIVSRTSSIGSSSKGSLMSSRSNSTNSRSSSGSSSSNNSSSCSSARTSSSQGRIYLEPRFATGSSNEGSNRRKLIKLSPVNVNQSRSRSVPIIKTKTNSGTGFAKKESRNREYCNGYGQSQRWQFIAPVPALNRRNSARRRKGGNGKQDGGVRKGVCRRFFRWLVSTCQECHAIEPSKRLKVSL